MKRPTKDDERSGTIPYMLTIYRHPSKLAPRHLKSSQMELRENTPVFVVDIL
jgi:hypothetical protein